MTDKNPRNFKMDDLIRSVFMNPCDAMAHADIVDEPAIEEQARAPSPNELADLEKLAEAAARLQDDIKANPDDRSKQLKVLKDELLDKMLTFKLNSLEIPGRPAIEVTTSRSTKANRKNLIATMQELLGDEKKGKTEALRIWDRLPMPESHSLKIPDPSPPEVDSPY